MAAEKLQDLIEETKNDLERKRAEIVRQALAMKSNMDAVIEKVANGYHLNSCGEIQSRGASFDILCAEHEMIAADIAKLEWAAK